MSSMGRRFAALALLLGLAGCEDGVGPAVPTSLVVGSEAVDLMVGDFVPIAVQILDQQGRVMERLKPVFTSSNPSVATVDAAGMMRAVSPGSAGVTAIYGSLRATVAVTVHPDDRQHVRTLTVAVDSLVADTRGGAQPVTVEMINGMGQPVCPQLTFHSSDVVVATARAAGACRLEVVPSHVGEATITVTAGPASDSFRVRVTSTGAVAFFSDRPAAADVVAGATVGYTVRVIDQTGAGLAGTRVYFSATVGEFAAGSVLTDGDGYARAQWQIPTHLAELGQSHRVYFRTQLPTGQITGQTEYVYIDGASLARLALYTGSDYSGWRPITGPIDWARYDGLLIGARGFDQYGNLRRTPLTFTHTSTTTLYRAGPYNSGSLTYVRVYTYTAGTAVVTATAPGGISQSVQITFR